MNTWSVKTRDENGAMVIITDGLTEKQARDVVRHLRAYHHDFSASFEEE